ncbi:MAG: ADP-dependent NAD(P)H-hydrate dehydratase / NAD(P)H-hydrate epimerase [Acidobacteriota bacterium]|jgi:NAD(P)H-hydrate epimerase|nr:ADP-dependent NAD(P)H-hydrate dehydratase / NAD(P)H-hydrate epimerase [Acidobacteriota bacterium]
MKILNAEQMRNIDRRTTERFGVPSIVLMENAAIAVVEAIGAHFPDADRVAIFCGTGANGGDGFAVARHLENRGIVPVLIVVGDRASIRGDAETNRVICERLGIPLYEVREADDIETALAHAADADLLVDAIFGTGLNRAPEGMHEELIRGIAELRIPVLAIDLPSGANASSPEPFEPCIQAEVTVTFAAPKVCHVFEPAATYCGEVIVADISIPEIAVDEESVSLALITPKDVQPHVAPRLPATHKGTYGHVAVIAGSPGRSGAAVLAARGAIRAGAGLVTVMTDPDTAQLIHAASIESMTYSGTALDTFLANKTAALIGPGLADDERSYRNVRALVDTIELPLVIDASALNAFAGQPQALNPRGLPRVITPHPGELARILGTDTHTINADRIGAARAAARATNCVVVLKGHQTLVAELDDHVWVNPTGNPGMASGGMGDVLSGILAAFLARDTDPLDAACAAVYLHGLAGDLLAEEFGDTGLAAMDLAERIPRAIQKVRG